MVRRFTKYPSTTIKASKDYSVYYGNVAVPEYIKDSEIVSFLLKCIEAGTLNGYSEWHTVNFLAGYYRDRPVDLNDITYAIIEAYYNHPEVKNYDKLERLGV